MTKEHKRAGQNPGGEEILVGKKKKRNGTGETSKLTGCRVPYGKKEKFGDA